MTIHHLAGLMLAGLCVLSSQATLSGAEPGRTDAFLGLQLQAADQRGENCRLSFLFENRLGKAIDELTFELVVFGVKQQVERLTKLSIGFLPEGKSQVRQYDLNGLACERIARLLLNDIPKCSGDGLSPKSCLQFARPSSAQSIPFIY